jgi:CubicO group peptidase (beta-lactamase class C family)
MVRRLPPLLAATVLALGFQPARAQDGKELDPATAARVDSVFAGFTAPGSPGCALGIMRDGRLVYAKGYGLASIELGVPIGPATVFDIGSVSKQFTALAVVLLAQDRKLALDDEIQKYLPEIPRYAKPVTIRHLLHHTSGLRDYIDLLFWSGALDESVTGDREALEILSRQRAPNFAAGAEHLYSNSGYFLLSQIVKRASDRSLRAFAAERIFGPLGMQHTFFLDNHSEIVPDKAASYAPAEYASDRFQLALANWEQTGDGGVQTTVQDLLRWDSNFSSGVVGGPAALRELETPGVLNDGKSIVYALGLVVDSSYRGVRRVSHGGAWAGFRAFLTRFPNQRVSLSTLCNVANANPSQLAQRVADILLAGELQAPTTSPFTPFTPQPGSPARPLADYVGRYHSDELLADWVVRLAGDSLRVRIGPLVEETVALTPRGFRFAGAQLRFLETDGRVTGISLTSRGARDFRLTRIIQ